MNFLFGNPYFLKSLPVQNIDQAALIHKNLGDIKFIYIHGYDHGVVLGTVDGSEVIIC